MIILHSVRVLESLFRAHESERKAAMLGLASAIIPSSILISLNQDAR